jgi:hypothetical protein
MALCMAGCLSPTLPLPPPSDPTVSSTQTLGLVRLTGTVEPQSEVFALNRNNNLISGQYTESGAYDFTLQAQHNDYVSLWFVHGPIESPSNDFVVKLPAPKAP